MRVSLLATPGFRVFGCFFLPAGTMMFLVSFSFLECSLKCVGDDFSAADAADAGGFHMYLPYL